MALTLPDFSKANIIVYGDVMLDRYWHGNTSRISPEAPVPVVHVKHTDDRPGGAGNVALNMASLGAKVQLFAPCGDDEPSKILTQRLSEQGVSCYFKKDPNWLTVLKLRIMSVSQQLLRCDFEDNTQQDHSDLQQACIDVMTTAQALVLSDYAKGALYDPQPLIQAARQHNLPVIVDPKNNDFSVYQGASLLTPNFKEFQAVVGHCADDKDIIERGEALIQQHDFQGLLVTLGARGMMLLQRGHQPVHLLARSNEVFDVTGAGDTVIATLAASIAAGASYANAMSLANIAAGKVVSKLGTAQITKAEMQQLLQAESRHHAGVVSSEQLTTLLDKALKNNESIAIIQGEFDILTADDLILLNFAGNLADRLLLVTPPGPAKIHSEERRLTVLTALQAVDWVLLDNSFSIEHFSDQYSLAKAADVIDTQGHSWQCYGAEQVFYVQRQMNIDYRQLEQKITNHQQTLAEA